MDQKITSNPIGRPSVITPDTVAKLVSILERGLSVSKACSYAHIDRASFYRKYNEDEEFRNRIEDAKNYAVVLAGEIVVEDILKHRNVQTAKWYLERKDPEEFSQSPQVQVNAQKQENFFISTAQAREMFKLGFNPSEEDMLRAIDVDPESVLD